MMLLRQPTAPLRHHSCRRLAGTGSECKLRAVPAIPQQAVPSPRHQVPWCPRVSYMGACCRHHAAGGQQAGQAQSLQTPAAVRQHFGSRGGESRPPECMADLAQLESMLHRSLDTGTNRLPTHVICGYICSKQCLLLSPRRRAGGRRRAAGTRALSRLRLPHLAARACYAPKRPAWLALSLLLHPTLERLYNRTMNQSSTHTTAHT